MRNRPRARDGIAVSMQSGAESCEDPFALLGVARAYLIDDALVTRAQVRALVSCHPDRHAEGVERESAIVQSARVNRAASIVRDPLTRAESLIALEDPHGVAVSLTPAQLIALLERREEAEIVDESSAERCREICTWVREEIRSSFDSLVQHGTARGVDWTKARAIIAYLRALTRLLSEVNRLEQFTQRDLTP